MTEDEIEAVRATYAAWNEGDWGLERFHPEVEWELLGKGAFDQAGPARGRERLLSYWKRFWAAWKPGARWEVTELQGVGGGQVLAAGRMHAVGRSSGVQSADAFFHVWTVRDGLIVRLLICDDRATAMKAASS